MKTAFHGVGVVLIALALVALVVQYAPSKDETGSKRTAHLHAVAYDIAAYAAEGDHKMPSSTADPEFRAALPQQFEELEKRFIFNTRLFGQDTLKLTQAQLRAPLVIQREAMRDDAGRILLKYVDLEGEEYNVDSDAFPLSQLDDVSRRQVEAIIVATKG